jgi:hypothetical protein
MSETESQARRRRWINFGELIAVLALIVSAAGVWVSWKSSGHDDKPATIVEQHKPVALVLRGRAQDDGRSIEIAPVDPNHAVESMTVTVKGASPIEVGSDGRLDSGDVQSALSGHDKEPKDKTFSVPATISARYVEDGTDRHGGGTYTLRYRWAGGGLFGGRSLRLVGLSR